MFLHKPSHYGTAPLPSSRDLVPSEWLGLVATARNWPLTGGGLAHVPSSRNLSSLVAVLGLWYNSADFIPTASLRTKERTSSRLATTRPSVVGMTQLSAAGEQPVHFRKANKHFESPAFLVTGADPMCRRPGYCVLQSVLPVLRRHTKRRARELWRSFPKPAKDEVCHLHSPAPSHSPRRWLRTPSSETYLFKEKANTV